MKKGCCLCFFFLTASFWLNYESCNFLGPKKQNCLSYECYKVGDQMSVMNGLLAIVMPISQSKQLCFDAFFYQMMAHEM